MSSTTVRELLILHTGGTGDVTMLRGPSNRHARRRVIETVTGHPIRLVDAGWWRMLFEVEALAGIGQGPCEAVRLQHLKNWIIDDEKEK